MLKINLIDRILGKLRRTKIVDVTKLHTVQEIYHLRQLFQYLEIDIVYDIGANQGQYAEMLRKHVGYKGIIVSVEPIPEMVDELERKSKNDSKWHIEAIVISDTEGIHQFNVMNDRECSSLSTRTFSETSAYEIQTRVDRTITVSGITLESLVNKWNTKYKHAKNSYLKLDTQGYDLQILNAARNVISQFAAFQSELSVKRLYESSTHLEVVLDAYRKFGFDVSTLVPNNGGHFPDLIEIDCIMVRSDLIVK